MSFSRNIDSFPKEDRFNSSTNKAETIETPLSQADQFFAIKS